MYVGIFQSNTIVNPKEEVNAIYLRSGREVGWQSRKMAEPPMEEKEEELAEPYILHPPKAMAEQEMMALGMGLTKPRAGQARELPREHMAKSSKGKPKQRRIPKAETILTLILNLFMAH